MYVFFKKKIYILLVKEGFVYDKNHEKQERVKETTGPNVQITESVTLNTQFFKFFVSIYGSFVM